MALVGIIGGSGLDDPELIDNPRQISVTTPYGEPSSTFTSGTISGVDVLILARHGLNHQFSPTEVNNKANIYAFKELAATHLLATTACGSLREEIDRGHLVIADQFIDFTRHRDVTFNKSFANGVNHPAMADPFDPSLRNLLIKTADALGYAVHKSGTIITIEGPRFSTRAESRMYRSWGADVVNMSIAPEAILANELEIPYAVVAMSTDYDSWKEDEDPVSWQEILEVFADNANRVKNILRTAISAISD